MSRLIDADKLIQEMSEWYWDKEKQKAAENDVSPMDLFTHLAITTVQEQPTAFDLDKELWNNWKIEAHWQDQQGGLKHMKL